MNSLNRDPDQGTGAQPFRLANNAMEEPSIFELTFVQENIRYDYRLVLGANVIQEEVLYAYPRGRAQRWYHRQHDTVTNKPLIDLGASLKGRLSALHELARPNLPILALATILNNPQLMNVQRWFSAKMVSWFHDPGSDITPVQMRWLMTSLVANNPQLHQPLSALLRLADVGIRDFAVREDITISVTGGEEPTLPLDLGTSQQRQKFIQFRHTGANGYDREPIFSIEEESRGTQQLFILGTVLLMGLDQGQVLIIDELDTSLHPQLVRALVELFHRENPNNAQLIFNTHDASLLRGDLFDRDQIWFIEKDRQGSSRLYPLLDFREQPGEDLERGYLRGRYGAVPLIDRLTWEELRTDAAAS